MILVTSSLFARIFFVTTFSFLAFIWDIIPVKEAPNFEIGIGQNMFWKLVNDLSSTGLLKVAELFNFQQFNYNLKFCDSFLRFSELKINLSPGYNILSLYGGK